MFAARNLRFTTLNPASVALYFYDASATSLVTVVGGSPLLVSSWASTAGTNNIGRTLAQGVSLDQPQYNGSNRVTFADSSDVLTFNSAVTQAGWQIVGTSRGTFAYLTNASSQSAMRLFGNQGFVNTSGDLYGVILLPADASSAMIQKARQILIDRGAVSEVVGNNTSDWWRDRTDIVEFGHRNFSSVTTFQSSWNGCTSLTSFPLIDTSNGITFTSSWNFCSSLTSFPLIDTSKGTTFVTAWQNCTSLTSFPLIDTSNGTIFQSSWNRCSSLTSFPLINTSKGTNFRNAWNSCTSLTSFPAGFFDNWTGTPVANCFLTTWGVTTALTAASVENIFNSINTSGRVAPATGKEITVVYNTATGTPNITTAVTNLKSRGWTPRLNGTLL